GLPLGDDFGNDLVLGIAGVHLDRDAVLVLEIVHQLPVGITGLRDHRELALLLGSRDDAVELCLAASGAGSAGRRYGRLSSWRRRLAACRQDQQQTPKRGTATPSEWSPRSSRCRLR